MLSSIPGSRLSPRAHEIDDHRESSETNCVLPDEGPHVFEIEPEVLSNSVNKKLVVKEAWVVWEPIPGLEDVRGVRRAVQHSFLVFVLEPGEWLAYQNEKYICQYLRVERQQRVVPETTKLPYMHRAVLGDALGVSLEEEEEAFLNFRFCRDPLVVKGLDIPGSAEIKLTNTYLKQKRVEQFPKQPIRFKKQLTLGVLLDVIMTAHNERKQYDFATANCIWFVGKIIETLAAMEYVSDSVLEELSKDMRCFLARNLKNGVEALPEELVAAYKLLPPITKAGIADYRMLAGI